MNGVPYNLIINSKIFMNDKVPEVFDYSPLYLPDVLFKFIRNFCQQLPQLFQNFFRLLL